MIEPSIIFFDGVCNLCNKAVQFIIKKDKKERFRFASLQSEEAQKFLESKTFPIENFDSFILIDNGKLYTRSTAALKVVQKLNGLWPLLYSFIIIPQSIRDNVYKWVAKNRYKWFGKKDECMIPSAKLKARFLN